jgi:tRNA threonylcarbamoyladenosine biosynthesis protein TsaE
MKVHKLVYMLDTIDDVAEDLYELLASVSVLAFSGPLGAGKTTLIQALLRKGGIFDTVQSPTFTYLTTYVNASGFYFYHFDLYRLKSLEDFLAAGFEEYLYQPQSCALIEWPEIIKPLLKKRVALFSIEYYGEDRRCLVYTVCGNAEEA